MTANPYNEDLQITLCHGPKKIKIDVQPILQLKELNLKIESLFSIKKDGQKIIFKGKLLIDSDVSLIDLGIKNGDTIMVLGKVTNPEESKKVTMLEQDNLQKELDLIGNTYKDVEARVKEIINDIESANQSKSKAKKKQNDLKVSMQKLLFTNEELMRLLETLDAMEIEVERSEERAKRKSIIKEIQKLMDEVDEDYNKFEANKSAHDS